MDDDAFRRAYQGVDGRACPFEKAILTNHAGCARARRFCIAEREGVHCSSDPAQERCLAFLDLVRQQGRFALKDLDAQSALTHAKSMRVQIGGLRAVALTLSPEDPIPERIADIDGLLRAAFAELGALEALPAQTIIQQVAAYRGRRPGRRAR